MSVAAAAAAATPGWAAPANDAGAARCFPYPSSVLPAFSKTVRATNDGLVSLHLSPDGETAALTDTQVRLVAWRELGRGPAPGIVYAPVGSLLGVSSTGAAYSIAPGGWLQRTDLATGAVRSAVDGDEALPSHVNDGRLDPSGRFVVVFKSASGPGGRPLLVSDCQLDPRRRHGCDPLPGTTNRLASPWTIPTSDRVLGAQLDGQSVVSIEALPDANGPQIVTRSLGKGEMQSHRPARGGQVLVVGDKGLVEWDDHAGELNVTTKAGKLLGSIAIARPTGVDQLPCYRIREGNASTVIVERWGACRKGGEWRWGIVDFDSRTVVWRANDAIAAVAIDRQQRVVTATPDGLCVQPMAPAAH